MLPASSWWDRAVAGRRPEDIDPHLPSTLQITPQTRVASAGSCFAQHISRALLSRGYNYFITETAPVYLSQEQSQRYNYGVFSARYGNIYTTLQLLQLVERAFGKFVPVDQFWGNEKGRTFDLLRPRIVPQGFASLAEAEAENRQHLAAVRKLIETTDVFVFTLGLTEGWISQRDGTAYPTCPGCGSSGDYDPSKYQFHNHSVAETSDQLSKAIDLMTAANPAIQIVLTVSPVPLVATMEPRHVLQATAYSKSVLRVAAEEMVSRCANVHYFASYEIITATRNAHVFIGDDGRTIAAEGVTRAMDVFFTHFAAADDHVSRQVLTSPNEQIEQTHRTTAETENIVCDEEDFFCELAKTPPQ